MMERPGCEAAVTSDSADSEIQRRRGRQGLDDEDDMGRRWVAQGTAWTLQSEYDV